MNYSGYNVNHQQQHSYEYDPSQIQPYDQSSYQYQPYYPYNHQYGYFPDTNQPHLHYQPEPNPVHPPGVNPTALEPVQHRPNHAPTGPSQYRGRGGRAFRRGGHGPASYRGRGRGRHFPSHSSVPAASDVPGAPAAAGDISAVQTASSVSGQTTLPKPAQVPPAPSRKVFCEICKVECNTPEIMEQHKNGKRHKKNMKVHEELQRQNIINGQQSEQIPNTQLNLADQPEQVQKHEKEECPTENMGSEITADNHQDEIKLLNNLGQNSEVPGEEAEGITTDNSAARGRGLKRKMRGGKVGKYMKTNDGSRSVQAEQAISFHCELCNVKCESQVVYQSHLSGKKHLSKLKRSQQPQALPGVGHQALSGTVGHQAVYPPDINALANAINAQVQQGDNDPQLLLAQLLMNVLSQAQAPAPAPAVAPSGPLAAQIPAPTSVALSSYEPQLSQTLVSDTTAHVGMENPTGETKNELLPVPVEFNAVAGSSATQIEGGSSENKQVPQDSQDSSGMTPADNSGATNDQIPS